MSLRIYMGLVSAVFALSPWLAYAQLLPNLANVDIALSPTYPQPGATVYATVGSASENVRASDIVWFLDSQRIAEGPGETAVSFIAPEAGSSQTIRVLVRTPSGQVLSDSLTMRPARVSLVWEADTYTPPFYEGRSLYSSGSRIRAEALPEFITADGRRLPAAELIYTWSKNGVVLGSTSGRGANSIVTNGPKFLGSYILAVEVQSADGSLIAQAAAQIETTEPRIRLYERDPLVGITYHEAITDDHEFSGPSQFQIHASPYFMDVRRASEPTLNYSWHVNGTRVLADEDTPADLIVQLAVEESVQTRVRVAVDHAFHLLQSGLTNVRINLGTSARNSIFGF